MKKISSFLLTIYKRDKKKLFFVFLFSFLLIPVSIGANSQEYVPGEIIVKFREEKRTDILLTSTIAEKNGLQKKEKIFKEKRDKNLELFSIKERRRPAPNLSSIYKLVFDEDADIEKIVEEYKNSPYVEYAHLNYRAILHTTPNDTHFDEQWGLQKVEAPDAWNIERGSEDIVIAVVDTGIDYEHEDLMENMWDGSECKDEDGDFLGDCIHGYDFFSDDSKDPKDNHSHGTHVAGIISAVTDNNIGIAGTSWNSKLMAIKIFENEKSSAPASEIVKAIKFAVENGADIISNSWGYVENVFPESVRDAIDYANREGSLVIFSAGNSGSEGDYYPAAYLGKDEEGNPYEKGDYQGTLAVAGTMNSSDEIANFSTYGEWVNVSAPSVNILSTVLDDNYDGKGGTSMAAPFVSGLAALIWSADATLTREEVWQIIEDTADNIDDKNESYAGKIGTGRINAYSALSLITTRVNFKEENELEGVLIEVYSDEEYESFVKEKTSDESGEAFIYLLDGNYWYKATKEDYDNHYDSFILEEEQEPLSLVFDMDPIPKTETAPATDVSYNSATLNGELTDIALEEDVKVFFRWRKIGEEPWNETEKEERVEEGTFNLILENLTANTSYEFKAVVEFEEETKENKGDVTSFTTELSTECVTFSNLEANYLEVYIEEEIVISVDIKNETDKEGFFTAKFKVEGVVVGEDTLLLESESTRTFSISYNKDVAGEYLINIEEYEGEESELNFKVFNFPKIETAPATGISYNAATLNGELTDIALEEDVKVFFRWRKIGEELWNETEKEEKTEEGTFNLILENLTANTSYEFKAVVEFEEETKENKGDVTSFTTRAKTASGGGGGGGGGGGSTATTTTTTKEESSSEEDKETKEKENSDKEEKETTKEGGGRSLQELNDYKDMISKTEKTISLLFRLAKERDTNQKVIEMLLDVEKRVEDIKKEIEEEIKEKEEELDILIKEKERAAKMEKSINVILSVIEKREDGNVIKKEIVLVLERIATIRERIEERIGLI